jgi:hypothetical protein
MWDEERRSRLIDVLRRKQVPIVTLDIHWHQLFPEGKKNGRIQKLEADVNDLLKKQGKTTNDLQEMRKLKTRLMQNIMDNMESKQGDEERTREKRMGKSQKLIKDTREKIDDLEYEEMTLPQKIKDANRELIMATAEECYDRLQNNREDIKRIAKWIAEVRVELKEKLDHKLTLEEENNLIYSTMHDMLGHEIMEYFDDQAGQV